MMPRTMPRLSGRKLRGSSKKLNSEVKCRQLGETGLTAEEADNLVEHMNEADIKHLKRAEIKHMLNEEDCPPGYVPLGAQSNHPSLPESSPHKEAKGGPPCPVAIADEPCPCEAIIVRSHRLV